MDMSVQDLREIFRRSFEGKCALAAMIFDKAWVKAF